MGSCPAGWLPFGQDCFQFNAERTSKMAAKFGCEKEGGTLAIIKTSLQQAFLSAGIREKTTSPFIGEACFVF